MTTYSNTVLTTAGIQPSADDNGDLVRPTQAVPCAGGCGLNLARRLDGLRTFCSSCRRGIPPARRLPVSRPAAAPAAGRRAAAPSPTALSVADLQIRVAPVGAAVHKGEKFAITVDPGVAQAAVAGLDYALHFAWRCTPSATRQRLEGQWCAGGGLVCRLVKSETIPGTWGRATAGGSTLVFSEDLATRTGAIATVAHEFAHSSGASNEQDAWRLAASWLLGTGVPYQHALAYLARAEGN